MEIRSNSELNKDVFHIGMLLCALLLAGCGDESAASHQNTSDESEATDGMDAGIGVDASEIPTTYNFYAGDESALKYSGQAARHTLITELKAYIAGLTIDIDAGVFMPSSVEEVVDSLDYYFLFDSDADGETTLTISTTPEIAQATFNEISTGKDLAGKLAGNDAATDHKDWSAEFVGWPSVESPEALVYTYFTMIGDNAVARANGEYDLDVHLTEDGLDLAQLVQKFLLMAITFSQGLDDYLDSDVADKGLLSSNEVEEGALYSPLAHSWDEGFGYFGAARDYNDYSDEEIASKGGRDDYQGYHDSDGDGFISLTSEYNAGASVNAAKRDLGSSEEAPTDFTKEIFDAFLAGRTLIAKHPTTLTDELMTELDGYRDAIVLSWEKAIAATVVHYINDVIRDMATIGTDDYSFAGHAKHWSEMKGFALGLQFSPHSPLSDEDFAAIHEAFGTAPTLEGADDSALETYLASLLEARDRFQAAYSFDAANMGDENGGNGW